MGWLKSNGSLYQWVEYLWCGQLNQSIRGCKLWHYCFLLDLFYRFGYDNIIITLSGLRFFLIFLGKIYDLFKILINIWKLNFKLFFLFHIYLWNRRLDDLFSIQLLFYYSSLIWEIFRFYLLRKRSFSIFFMCKVRLALLSKCLILIRFMSFLRLPVNR